MAVSDASRLFASVGFALSLAAACGPSEPACMDALESSDSNPEGLVSVPLPSLVGLVSLSPGSEPGVLQLRLEVNGLPPLWSAAGAARGRLTFSLEPRFADATVSGSQQPQVRALLTAGSDVRREVTTATASTLTLPLFDCALDGTCCEFGSESCSQLIEVQLIRLDNGVMSPVNVEWSAQATLEVDTCPQQDAMPRGSFEAVSP